MQSGTSSLIALVLAFFVWGALHSITASAAVKQRVAKWFGDAWVNRWYRLAYNLFAGATFLPILAITAMAPSARLTVLPGWLGWFALGIQLLMVILMALAVKQTGLLRFIGLAPQTDGKKTDGAETAFIADGLYGLVRHPIYTTSLVALWLSQTWTDASFLFALLVTLYILIGIQFEERRLLREFGQVYADYQKRVPMLIPFLKK